MVHLAFLYLEMAVAVHGVVIFARRCLRDSQLRPEPPRCAIQGWWGAMHHCYAWGPAPSLQPHVLQSEQVAVGAGERVPRPVAVLTGHLPGKPIECCRLPWKEMSWAVL